MDRTLILSKLKIDVHDALKLWYEPNTESSPLSYLRLFQQALAKGATNSRQATNEILLDGLETLAAEHEIEASMLRKRFLDGQVMQSVANWLNRSESSAYRKQREAIEYLALILQAKERKIRDDYQVSLEKRLKLPSEVELIGVEEHLNLLSDILGLFDPPWIVSIEGLGGIGKTALANALLHQPGLTGQFYDIAWVSAKRQDFLPGMPADQVTSPSLTVDTLIDMLLEQLDKSIPLAQSPQEKITALTKILKKELYLIVIDNLETVVDYQALLPTLHELANPSKFLLTSRHSLRAYPDVFCHGLKELDQAQTIRFIKHEAKIRGLPMLANATKPELKNIYEVVGGNPLALKLVIGQISILPLSRVVENLKQARGKEIDSLYTYIYWQTWHILDAASQQLLLVMPLAQDGTLDQLVALSQLELNELNSAMQQLATLSLIQISGTLEERRYTIHRLTETFLLYEAIKWQSLP